MFHLFSKKMSLKSMFMFRWTNNCVSYDRHLKRMFKFIQRIRKLTHIRSFYWWPNVLTSHHHQLYAATRSPSQEDNGLQKSITNWIVSNGHYTSVIQWVQWSQLAEGWRTRPMLWTISHTRDSNPRPANQKSCVLYYTPQCTHTACIIGLLINR